MNRPSSRKQTIACWLAVMLMAALLPIPVGTSVAHAQSVPPACLNDAGQPVRPAPVLGAWALALNFNHALSASDTVGCRILTIALQPQKVSYTLVTCQLSNNSRGVQVGAGAAPLDGNFWITCPNGPPVPGYGPLYDGFAVYGRAQFPALATPASFTFVQHQDVVFTAEVSTSASVTGNTRIKLTSRYGPYTYATTDTSTTGVGPFFLASSVGARAGRHQVEQNVTPFTTPVDQFPFTFSQPILIGQSGKPWTLYELVVDPPPPRGSFSG